AGHLDVDEAFGAERLRDQDLAAELAARAVRRERCVLEVLRTDAQPDRPPLVAREPAVRGSDGLRNRELLSRDRVHEPTVPALDARLDEIHRGTADEAGDEEVCRCIVEALRIVDLLQLALAEDGDA